MRIALLTTNMARGGAETQVAHLALALHARGHEVHVVSMLRPSAFTGELGAAGIKLHAPGISRIPLLLLRLRPEVLHCHMFHANLFGRLLRTVLPFPAVISTLHSVAESKRGSNGGVYWRDLAYRLTDWLADEVTGVSQAVVERHVSARAVRRDALVIPNGVDTAVFRPDPPARVRIRHELQLGNAFVWIAVGRLMWKKNFRALVETMAQIAGAELLIAGAGPEEMELRKVAGSNVWFLGERRDVPALLSAADGFVLSSLVEGLPLALLEAAACGLPCVATDAGGVRETGIGLVVDNVSGLRTAMQQMQAASPAARDRMGREARAIVQARYSIDAIVTEWEALYRTLTRWT